MRDVLPLNAGVHIFHPFLPAGAARFPRWGVIVLVLLAAILATEKAQAQRPVVKIVSPTDERTYAYGDIKRRALHWDKKKKELYAEVTFSDEKYAGGGSPAQQETFSFLIPGATFDEKTETYLLPDEKGGLWPFATRKKGLFGVSSIEPVRNAVVRVLRLRTSVEVTAEIYRPEEVAQAEADEKAAEKKQKDAESHDVDTQSLIGR